MNFQNSVLHCTIFLLVVFIVCLGSLSRYVTVLACNVKCQRIARGFWSLVENLARYPLVVVLVALNSFAFSVIHELNVPCFSYDCSRSYINL